MIPSLFLALLMAQNPAGEMVRIPAGAVPAFDLGRTEVTVRQFRAFVDATGYRTDAEQKGWAWVCCWPKVDGVNWRNPGFEQSDDNPVVVVSWRDAVEYTKWLAARTGQPYRLPSEAEWEYAARAGAAGESPADLDQAAWYQANSEGKAHPAGRKQPNAWGLHDMLGNAWEWTSDVFAEPYGGPPSAGRGFAAGEGRVLRGGAWGLGGKMASFTSRPAFPHWASCNNSGFRVARSVPK